ncbi:MAG: hypothetical protein GMKNLPBB_02781 [Myxococcota bacterium]|nr:hypothetical protein [Myxococcota bacterium]
MLWTLHNRAGEALRTDSILRDEHAVRIHRSIAYDYERSFGKPDASHAVRSLLFDRAIKQWMAEHPGGSVVELGCGLETQFQRLDDGQIRWYCVDLPGSIAIRERFLPPTERCMHIAASVLDLSWMDGIATANGVFVSAQGLLMYFEPAKVQGLIQAICGRFPGVELMFDTIPRWFSKMTLSGFRRTRHYTAPPMPWGVNPNEIQALLRSWSPAIATVELVRLEYPRGIPALLLPVLSGTPVLRELLPSVVRVRTAAA